MYKKLAPITLFVYNRLFHTRCVLEALENNKLAKNSDLFIYIDGPKDVNITHSNKSLYDFLVKYKSLYERKKFKSISIIIRTHNYGLAENITQGITEILEKYGKIIVFEDDTICSPHTLEYFNQALD